MKLLFGYMQQWIMFTEAVVPFQFFLLLKFAKHLCLSLWISKNVLSFLICKSLESNPHKVHSLFHISSAKIIQINNTVLALFEIVTVLYHFECKKYLYNYLLVYPKADFIMEDSLLSTIFPCVNTLISTKIQLKISNLSLHSSWVCIT